MKGRGAVALIKPNRRKATKGTNDVFLRPIKKAAGHSISTRDVVFGRIDAEIAQQAGLKSFTGTAKLNGGTLEYRHDRATAKVTADDLEAYSIYLVSRGRAVKYHRDGDVVFVSLTAKSVDVMRRTLMFAPGRPVAAVPKRYRPPLIERRPPSPPKGLVAPQAKSLLKPILIAVGKKSLSYQQLRDKTAKSLAFPVEFINVSIPDKGGDSFNRNFDTALNHLLNCRLVQSKKKLLTRLDRAEKDLTTIAIPEMKPAKPRPRPRSAKTARLKNAIATGRMIGNLTEAEPFKLLTAWKNAVRMLAEPSQSKWHGEAQAMADAISKEWDRRAKYPELDAFFKWPSTEPRGGGKSQTYGNIREDGMLRYLEYRVGKNGEHSSYRQTLLSRIFENSLPPVFDKLYMAEWGSNGSSIRLHKMAHCLASFARNFKWQKSDKFNEAIRHWEQDLEYLHDRYYVGKFSFGWPSTTI